MQVSAFNEFHYWPAKSLHVPEAHSAIQAGADRSSVTSTRAKSQTRNAKESVQLPAESAWDNRLRTKYGLDPQKLREQRTGSRWHDVSDEDDHHANELFEQVKRSSREHDNLPMRFLSCGSYPPKTIGDRITDPHETYTKDA